MIDQCQAEVELADRKWHRAQEVTTDVPLSPDNVISKQRGGRVVAVKNWFFANVELSCKSGRACQVGPRSVKRFHM